jgi:hypothetical protein
LRTVARKLEKGYEILAPIVEDRLNQAKFDPDNLPVSKTHLEDRATGLITRIE